MEVIVPVGHQVVVDGREPVIGLVLPGRAVGAHEIPVERIFGAFITHTEIGQS